MLRILEAFSERVSPGSPIGSVLQSILRHFLVFWKCPASKHVSESLKRTSYFLKRASLATCGVNKKIHFFLSFLSEGGALLRLRVEGKERRRINELFPLHSHHSFILSLEEREKES
jgi:hypothetical protein